MACSSGSALPRPPSAAPMRSYGSRAAQAARTSREKSPARSAGVSPPSKTCVRTLRRRPRIGPLVVARLVEAQAERLEPAAVALTRGQREHRARIEPTTEEEADGHIGHEAPAHGERKLLDDPLAPLGLADRAIGRE